MSKVKLTQAQADEIERIKKIGVPAKWLENGWEIERDKALTDLSLRDYVKAIYVGYEVEPEYKKGDWIVHIPMSQTRVISSLIKDKYGTYASFDNDMIQGVSAEYIRHATPQEIATEKTRRWWAKHDRDVLEIKQGDVLMRKHREIFEVTADPKSHQFSCYTGDDSFDFDIEEFERDNWRVVCFTEDRKDA